MENPRADTTDASQCEDRPMSDTLDQQRQTLNELISVQQFGQICALLEKLQLPGCITRNSFLRELGSMKTHNRILAWRLEWRTRVCCRKAHAGEALARLTSGSYTVWTMRSKAQQWITMLQCSLRCSPADSACFGQVKKTYPTKT